MSARSSATPSTPAQRRSLRVHGPGASTAEDTSFSISGAVYNLVTTRRKPTLQLLTRLVKMKVEAARSRQPARLTVKVDPAGNVGIIKDATVECRLRMPWTVRWRPPANVARGARPRS
jgi:hypothetical protein